MFSEYLCTSPVNKRIVGWMRKEGRGQKEDHR